MPSGWQCSLLGDISRNSLLQVLGDHMYGRPTPGMFMWLRGMTIIKAREVKIPAETSPEDQEDVEKCFGRDTMIVLT